MHGVEKVTEAINWQSNIDKKYFPCNISPADCLVEWGARLMTRSAHLSKTSDDEQSGGMLSRSHALLWCASANERSLPTLALDCIKRNTVDLYDEEALPWLVQRVLALRAMGLKQNDRDVLTKALETAEKFTPRFREHSTPEVMLQMNSLILRLNYDLGSLTNAKVDEVTMEVNRNYDRLRLDMSWKNKKDLNEICELMMMYYDDNWRQCEGATDKENTIVNMTKVLDHVIDKSINKIDVYMDTMLYRLDDCTVLGEFAARTVLDMFYNALPTLDVHSTREIKAHLHLFPRHVLSEFVDLTTKLNAEGHTTDVYRKYFQLICDPDHTLLQYCERLEDALRNNDAAEWKNVFDRMKSKIYENPYAGTGFQLLIKHKASLYEIYDFDTTYSSKKKNVLQKIAKELRSMRPQATLRLSQLCPALTSAGIQGDKCLARMLGLPDGVTVLKFDEQVRVFTDSVRRACVVRARASRGAARRYLHKGGERLRADAAAQRAAAVLTSSVNAPFVGYNVTPLTEDCGLIEYIEDHERIRTLISNNYDLDNIPISRPADKELILAPTQASIQTHHQLCAKVPSYALRSAIEYHCSSVQDFIAKKKRFTDTLASMTILNWILGLGDRHLQNILYLIQEGGVCGVDCGAVLQHARGAEPAPARLTRNLLAVCDTSVFESRLQNLLSSLREKCKLFLPVIKNSFKWMGEEFFDKLPYIEGILQGKTVSWEISKDVMLKSNCDEKYVQLLDNIFEKFNTKDYYSVEEQISCLLQHCTDPRILGVTRSGWEPWV